MTNSVFAFFTREVHLDEKHGLMFVTLKMPMGGNFWNLLAKTRNIHFKAAVWNEMLNIYKRSSCEFTAFKFYRYEFELKEDDDSRVVTNIFSQRNNDAKYQEQVLRTENPKDLTGGKRSMDNLNKSLKKDEDPTPQKKIKMVSNCSSRDDMSIMKIERVDF